MVHMSVMDMRISARIVLAAALSIYANSIVLGATCYTVPDEYRSELWEVSVDGRSNGVASARTCDPPFDKKWDFGGEYAFTSFEMDAPVNVTVRPKSARDMSCVRVLPASAPVVVRTLSDGALELKVERPCQFSVEPDGRRHPLLVFANPLERDAPDENDPKVKVYGPGAHLGGKDGRIDLKDGETLYLKAGAFVKGGIYVHGKGIRICGRGVLDGSDWKWCKGPMGEMVKLWDCENVTVEGITIRGAYLWTVVIAKSDNVKVRNIKICGGRVQNDDGIDPCNSRDVLIEDCFIRTDDDCIAAKGMSASFGNCENVIVRNCVLWCDRARVLLLGGESHAQYMRNFLYENCDVIRARLPVIMLHPGEDMYMENIRVKDFRINTDVPDRKYEIISARPIVSQFKPRKKVPGHISDCSFENISVTGERADCVFKIEGKDEEHMSRNIVISNASLYGKPVKMGDPSVRIGMFTENVVVKP